VTGSYQTGMGASLGVSVSGGGIMPNGDMESQRGPYSGLDLGGKYLAGADVSFTRGAKGGKDGMQ
jgi:hypothetical protein